MEPDTCEMIENLTEFVVEPGPQDYLVHCRITRNNKGLDHGNSQTSLLVMPFGKVLTLNIFII